MNTKKIILIVVILAVVGAGVYFFIPKQAKEQAPTWTYATVTSENIVKSITATGTIEPVTSVDVGTQVSGIVTNIYVDYNSVVKKGQIIAELDKSTLNLDLSTNKFTRERTKAEYEYELSNYNRVKDLYNSGLISAQEYEEQYFAYISALNSYESAKAAVKRSEINLGYATIYSPIDGVILSRTIEEGQTVASSYSTPTLFKVAADLTDMRVIANVDEADIADVREGHNVDFTVDAFPGEVFKGKITQVRQEATIESNVVTYEVVISAANPDLKLKPGLTASVEVFTLDEKCKAVVPASALVFDPGFDLETPPASVSKKGNKKKAPVKGDQVVWIKKGAEIHPRPVVVGISNGILTQVEGVMPGDTVATGMEYTFTAKGGQSASSPFVQRRGPKR